MNMPRPTGLGEPERTGKRTLFLPPKPVTNQKAVPIKGKKANTRPKRNQPKHRVERIRTTVELTPKALTILQKIKQEHRLRTGKALPLWKVLSQVIEAYVKVSKHT